MSNASPIAVAVFANSLDFWFTKICVASIRYYYPDVRIYLVKDKLNGDFDTSILTRRFNVEPLELGRKYYGWGAAKIHFVAHDRLPAGRYLVLDSDIIFLGKVLDRLQANPAGIIVNAERHKEPFGPAVFENYFDPAAVKKSFGNYDYPGFFFNSGQIVITSGGAPKDAFRGCFDFDNYPYFTNRSMFPSPDQSIFNYVLPTVAKERAIPLSGDDFMLWSMKFFEDPKADTIETLKSGIPYLVHYAGDTRTYTLADMNGRSMLNFFKEYYYSRLNGAERIRSDRQDRLLADKRYTKLLYRKNRLLMKLFAAK